MQMNFHTMDTRALTFAEALELHPMVKKACEEYANVRKTKRVYPVQNELGELWEGLCGTVSPEPATVMPRSVTLTMPIEYIPLVRRAAGITTAFAFCELAREIAKVDDTRDDMAVRDAMVNGWRAFELRRQEANAIQEGFGCDDSQSWHTMRDIAADLSKDPTLKQKMLAIAKLAGRMFEHFAYTRRDRANEDPEEVVGAKLGGQIDRVLPTELAMLGDEDTSDVQAMKILQNRAPIHETAGVESKTRGPLVLVIDESGSMHDGDGNYYQQTTPFQGRNTWAKACAVALTRIAWAEDRRVVAVHFGNGTVLQSVPKDDQKAMFELARSFLSGGTNFGNALEVGVRQVGDLASQGFDGADVLLITDGEDYNYPAHIAQIDKMDSQGIKLWTVAIGVDIKVEAPVRKRAERYTFAADVQLKNAQTAVTLAEGLNKAALGNEDPTRWN